MIVVIVAHVVLTQTRLGRYYTYAIGGNEDTVKLSGINSGFYKTLAYAIAGASAALSADFDVCLNSAEPIAGLGYELDVIAAVVIGGTSLNGGRGSLWGTFIGALMIGVINNGMNLLDISPLLQTSPDHRNGAVLLDRLREESA